MRTLQAILFAAVVGGGCAGTVGYRATVSTPDLVEVEPGVSVVADYDQPVFYNSGYYWRYDGGTWYRSPYHNRAWVHVSAPPVAVRHIDRPARYAHFHARAHVRTQARR